jgi:hypothetical protein
VLFDREGCGGESPTAVKRKDKADKEACNRAAIPSWGDASDLDSVGRREGSKARIADGSSTLLVMTM